MIDPNEVSDLFADEYVLDVLKRGPQTREALDQAAATGQLKDSFDDPIEPVDLRDGLDMLLDEHLVLLNGTQLMVNPSLRQCSDCSTHYVCATCPTCDDVRAGREPGTTRRDGERAKRT